MSYIFFCSFLRLSLLLPSLGAQVVFIGKQDEDTRVLGSGPAVDEDTRVWGSGPAVGNRQVIEEMLLQPSCGNLTYCSQPEHYPSLLIARALEGQAGLLARLMDADIPDISLNAVVSTEEACPTTTANIPLRVALNVRGEQMFIVNGQFGAQKLQQLVRVTTCLTEEGETCAAGNLGRMARTECQQRYTEHKLVALDMGQESGTAELVLDSFSLPSCCSCVIQSFVDF